MKVKITKHRLKKGIDSMFFYPAPTEGYDGKLDPIECKVGEIVEVPDQLMAAFGTKFAGCFEIPGQQAARRRAPAADKQAMAQAADKE